MLLVSCNHLRKYPLSQVCVKITVGEGKYRCEGIRLKKFAAKVAKSRLFIVEMLQTCYFLEMVQQKENTFQTFPNVGNSKGNKLL